MKENTLNQKGICPMKNTSIRYNLTPATAYVVKANSLRSAINRYNTLKALSNKFEDGDTFISDDVKDVIDYMSLGSMVVDMRRNYGLNIITTTTRHGEKIYDSRGKCVGKTTCNVYKFNADPQTLRRELANIPTIIAGMFD